MLKKYLESICNSRIMETRNATVQRNLAFSTSQRELSAILYADCAA